MYGSTLSTSGPAGDVPKCQNPGGTEGSRGRQGHGWLVNSSAAGIVGECDRRGFCRRDVSNTSFFSCPRYPIVIVNHGFKAFSLCTWKAVDLGEHKDRCWCSGVQYRACGTRCSRKQSASTTRCRYR